MDEKQLVVHQPEDGETLRGYLQRYSPEERQRIYEHRTLSKEFCEILVNNRWPRESVEESIEKSLENLWNILERLNNYRPLLHFIELLEPVRCDLLDSLHNYGDTISKISNWCSAGRIVCSAVDTAGTLGGLYLVEAKPSGDNWALAVATVSGLLGVMCTLAEVKKSSEACNCLMEKLRRDQKYLTPIQSWYQQSSKLEEEMLNIFPFDFTKKIVKEFIAIEEDNQLNPAKLLSSLLQEIKDFQGAKGFAENGVQRSAEKRDEGSRIKDDEGSRIKDETDDEAKLTEKLIRFVTSKQARELCLSLFLRRQHPIALDITRMALQLKYSSWPFYICQSVSALAQRDRTAYSVPVFGRIGLNLYSIYDGVTSIGKPRSHEIEIGQLQKHLEYELIALRKIALFIRLRSRGLIL